MIFVLLLIALFGLWIGAELAIRGARELADRFHLSDTFIGLTIFAIGTDLPELFISVSGSVDRLQGVETSGIIVGDIVGTVMGQTTIVLGIITLFGTLMLTKKILNRDVVVMLASMLLVIILGIDGELSRIDGGILLFVYAIYFFQLIKTHRKQPEKHKKHKNTVWAWISMIGGFTLLIFASSLALQQSLILAEIWGVNQTIVGILILGLGTSLPELITSITAIRQKAGGLAIGNLIGSNIYDLLFVLGISSGISGLVVERSLLKFDFPILLIILFGVALFMRSRKRLTKKEGFILIGIYLIYFILKLVLPS